MEYLDGEIEGDLDRSALRSHLARCAGCRSEVESLRDADATLRAADPAGTSPMPIESFLAAVNRRASALPGAPLPEEQRPRRRTPIAIASLFALAAATILAIVLVRRSDTPSEPDRSVASERTPADPDEAARVAEAEPDPVPAPLDPPALPTGLPGPDESAAYADALGAIQKSLRDAAAAADAAARDAALAAARTRLREFPSLAPRVFDGLDRGSCVAALELVSGSRDPLVVPAALRAAAERGIEAEAFAALASMPNPRALQSLAASASRPGEEGRAAIRALASAAKGKNPAALSALVRVALDPTSPERATAIAEVAGSEAPAAKRALLDLIRSDGSDQGVLAAAEARRADLLPELVQSLDGSRGEERRRTLAAIARIADESLLPFLSRHGSRGGRFAAEAAVVWGEIESDAAIEALIAVRGSDSAEVRDAAAEALGRRGEPVVAVAARALSTPNALFAIDALADVGSHAAIEALAAALGRPSLAAAAAAALARVPGDAALEALANGARAGSAVCRRAIERHDDPAAARSLLAIPSPGAAARRDGTLGDRREPATPAAPWIRRADDPEPTPDVTPRRPSTVRRPGSRLRPSSAPSETPRSDRDPPPRR